MGLSLEDVERYDACLQGVAPHVFLSRDVIEPTPIMHPWNGPSWYSTPRLPDWPWSATRACSWARRPPANAPGSETEVRRVAGEAPRVVQETDSSSGSACRLRLVSLITRRPRPGSRSTPATRSSAASA